MYFLIPIPIMLVGAMVRILSIRFKLDICKKVSSAIVILGIIFFVITYVQYYGFDNLSEGFKKFLDMKIK